MDMIGVTAHHTLHEFIHRMDVMILSTIHFMILTVIHIIDLTMPTDMEVFM